MADAVKPPYPDEMLNVMSRQASIVGSSFHAGAANSIARLRIGQGLKMVREPDNKYDKNAIAVYYFQQCLGYIPRGLAAEIAPNMDLGLKTRVTKSPKFPGTGVVDILWEVVADGPNKADTAAD